MYHEGQDKIFIPKRELLKATPPTMSSEDFEKAHKYFIFTDVKIKAPEISLPLIAQAPAESVSIQVIIVLATNHKDHEASVTKHHSEGLYAKQQNERYF